MKIEELSSKFYRLAAKSVYEIRLGDLIENGATAKQLVTLAMDNADGRFKQMHGDTVWWFRGFTIWAIIEKGYNQVTGLRVDLPMIYNPEVDPGWYPRAAAYVHSELVMTYIPEANNRLGAGLPPAQERQKFPVVTDFKRVVRPTGP